MSDSIALLIANTGACYHVAKSLAKQGYAVHVIHYEDNPIQHSRYISGYHPIYSPFISVSSSLQHIREIMLREKFRLMIPINDVAVELALQLTEFQDRIAGINLPEADAYRGKIRIWEKAGELGLPVHPGKVIHTIEAYEQLRNQLQLPLALKPQKSAAIINNRIHKFGVKVARTLEQVDDYIYEHINNTPVLLQQVADGFGAGFNFFAINGRVVSFYNHQRLTENNGGGVSSYRKTIPPDSYNLRETSEKLIAAMNWTGIGMLEYRITDGKPFIMELNGRPWGSIQVGIQAGSNPVSDMVSWKLHNTLPANTSYRNNVHGRKLKEDVKELIRNFKRSKNPVLLLKWLWSLRKALTANEFIEDIGFDDFTFKIKALKPSYENHPSIPVSTYRVAKHFVPGNRLCFVCYGNINRSAFAAAAFQQMHPDVICSSAGTLNKSNRNASRPAQLTAKQLQVNLSTHRSRWVKEPHEPVDFYIALDKKNYSDMLGLGLPPEKILLINTTGIIDPYQTNTETFTQVFNEIHEALTHITISKNPS